MNTQTQHSPGPWELDISKASGQWFIVNRTKYVVAFVAPNDYMALLVKLDAERKANAHLIAAAPDLLAACERVLEDLEGVGWGEVQGREADAWLDETEKALRAAIAKARGE